MGHVYKDTCEIACSDVKILIVTHFITKFWKKNQNNCFTVSAMAHRTDAVDQRTDYVNVFGLALPWKQQCPRLDRELTSNL